MTHNDGRRSLRMGVALVLVLALAGVLISSVAVGAGGVDNSPRVVAKVEGQSKVLRLQSSIEWVNPSGTCFNIGSAVGPAFQKRFEVANLNVRNRVVIWTALRPDRLKVKAWRRVDDGSAPLGPREVLQTRLRRLLRNDSTVAWVARFRAEVERRRYIEVRAKWLEPECDKLESYAWTYTLDRM